MESINQKSENFIFNQKSTHLAAGVIKLKTAFNNKSKKTLGSEISNKITSDDPIWMFMSFEFF